jgi:serpin B
MSSTRAAVALLLLASCSSEVPTPTGKSLDLAGRSTAFAFKLHGELLRANAGRNVVVSPASVLFAMSMAASGARGETGEEMLAALELKGWTREDLNASCAQLLRWLEGGEPGVRLDVANSAWLHRSHPFEPSYVKTLENDYRAQARAVPFDAKTLEAINEWVRDRTRGKIAGAGPRNFGPNDKLFLINAVYFKGNWKDKYEKSRTVEQPFHLAGEKTKMLPFMRRTARYDYAEAAGYQAVRIPYGEKGRMAFYVFLPKPGVSLSGLHDRLAALGPKWTSEFGSSMVQLELPRFKQEFEAQLETVLTMLGMKKAFANGQADFTGMSPKGRELSIDKVYHKTYVDVNEEGTEAAAVTTVAVGAKAAEPAKPVVFKVDRPFFCAIADDTTGAILFTGSIVEP